MLDDTAAEFAARGESFDHILKEIATTPSGPPKPRAPGLIEGLRKNQADLLEADTRIDEIDAMVTDTALHEQWHAVDRSAQQAYEQSAHFQNAAPPAEPGPTHEASPIRWPSRRVRSKASTEPVGPSFWNMK